MTGWARRSGSIATRLAPDRVSDTEPSVPKVEKLGKTHNLSSFSSGVDQLDRYLRTQAGQDARRNVATCYVLVNAEGAVAGYYTLSATAIALPELPSEIARRLPRYPIIPATLLGRLAVDRRGQGRGFGRFLLADALWRSLRSEIASFAVIVEAIDETARSFYERESFIRFPDQPLKLFRPMADIAVLFR